MKALKIILIVIGIALIAYGLIQAFVPETVFKIGDLKVQDQDGLTTQSIVTMSIGVVLLIIGGIIKGSK